MLATSRWARAAGLWIAGVALLASAPPSLTAQEFQVDRSVDRVVRFTSRAAIEEIVGVTDRIDGYVVLDGPRLSAETGGDDTEVYFEVDLAGLDTGIGLRNRHMRDNYLEVGRYPYAMFAGRIVRTERTPSGDFRVAASGDFTVHGVARPREIMCRVAEVGASLRAQCDFEVLLSDHGIDIPKIMFLKVAEEIRLQLDFTVTAAGGGGGHP